jgi:hypothetical protein
MNRPALEGTIMIAKLIRCRTLRETAAAFALACLPLALGAAFASGPASAAVRAPARAAAPAVADYSNHCSLTSSYCTILAENGNYFYGTDINEGLISNSVGDGYTWTPIAGNSPWGYLENANGNYLFWSTGAQELQTSVLLKNNSNFWFWARAGCGHEVISSADLGTGVYLWAPAGTGDFISHATVCEAGTELNWEG